MFFSQMNKFPGEQVGSTGCPGMGRLGDNDIIVFAGQSQCVACVIEDDIDPWILLRVLGSPTCQPAIGIYDLGFQLDDIHFLNRGRYPL